MTQRSRFDRLMDRYGVFALTATAGLTCGAVLQSPTLGLFSLCVLQIALIGFHVAMRILP